MKNIFLDTSYFIAILDRKDKNHEFAKSVAKNLKPCVFITSQIVLTEFLNYFSGRGKILRDNAMQLIEDLKSDKLVTIIPQTSRLFNKAVELYKGRSDKRYSLTDCSSMIILRSENIQEVLTTDKHFNQEGFCALLRCD